MLALLKVITTLSFLQLYFVLNVIAFQPFSDHRRSRNALTARPVSLAFADLGLEDHRDFQTEEKNVVFSDYAEQHAGVYKIMSKTQYMNFLTTVARNKIVVLKIFAPWCRACKALAPKFSEISHDEKYNNDLPIVWAELSVQYNKELIEELAVDALPTVQFYLDGRLEESFACGPSKSLLLKRKLVQTINANVDAETRLLKLRPL